jgi:hypothetical protein
MTNADFVVSCYQSILGRKPSKGELNHYLPSLDHGKISREQLALDFCSSTEFIGRLRRPNAEFVEAGHYYSAIPSAGDKRRAIEWSRAKNFDLDGVRLDWEAQWGLLRKLAKYLVPDGISRLPCLERRYHSVNPSFGIGDALFCSAIMQHFRPRHVIEVGCGYSSALMLDVNEFAMNSKTSFEFIEPFPELFFKLRQKRDIRWRLHNASLQDVNPQIFERLGENDILFIDSTHVLKAGSDVFHLLFMVLPALRPGVLIHIHDVLWPFEYPEAWLQEGRAWNEAYALRAFLQYNSSFSVLLFPNALARQSPDWFRDHAPAVLENTGGSIWLIRNA